MNRVAPIRVLVADDHEIVRQGLAQILEDTPGVEVVAQTGSAEQVAALVGRCLPDVLVLDYCMPDLDAPAVIQRVRAVLPSVKILVLTIHESVHYAARALESGANGFVVKSAAVRELVAAIQAVHRGEVFLSSRIRRPGSHPAGKGRETRLGIPSLSPREFELLRMLGGGLGLKECARRLDVTSSTASTYRARLLEKLSLRTTPDLIRFAIEHGIV